jgi:hypothetical protein
MFNVEVWKSDAEILFIQRINFLPQRNHFFMSKNAQELTGTS